MSRYFTCCLILFILSGCARVGGSSSSRIAPLQQLSGAKVVEDTGYLLWLEQRTLKPTLMNVHAIDQDGVLMEGAYLWRDGLLRELKQTGRRHFNDEMRPFDLHVRYDTSGVPVYQRFRIEGDTLPMKELELMKLYQEVLAGVELVKEQTLNGYELLQGTWNNGRFVDCHRNTHIVEFAVGQEYTFNDDESVALLGKKRRLSGNSVLQEVHLIARLGPDEACFQPSIEFE